MDSIYRILTRPDHKDETSPPRTYGPGPAVRPKAIMLPHTRPGGMAGLLEILCDQGGRVDAFEDDVTLAGRIGEWTLSAKQEPDHDPEEPDSPEREEGKVP